MKKKIFFIIFIFISYGINIYAQQTASFSPSSAVYTSASLRDPFEDYLSPKTKTKKGLKPVTAEEEEKPKPLPAFTIQGIIWEGVIPMAIINDKVVKVGDVIEGANIISIDKEGVNFLYYGREYKLSAPSFKGEEKKGGKE
jgi:type II secretory pathway component PulC